VCARRDRLRFEPDRGSTPRVTGRSVRSRPGQRCVGCAQCVDDQRASRAHRGPADSVGDARVDPGHCACRSAHRGAADPRPVHRVRSARGIAVLLSVSGLSLRRTDSNLVGAGVVSGFMGTVSGIGGPPIALVYHTSLPRYCAARSPASSSSARRSRSARSPSSASSDGRSCGSRSHCCPARSSDCDAHVGSRITSTGAAPAPWC